VPLQGRVFLRRHGGGMTAGRRGTVLQTNSSGLAHLHLPIQDAGVRDCLSHRIVLRVMVLETVAVEGLRLLGVVQVAAEFGVRSLLHHNHRRS